jgi:hypothetical protein
MVPSSCEQGRETWDYWGFCILANVRNSAEHDVPNSGRIDEISSASNTLLSQPFTSNGNEILGSLKGREYLKYLN